MDCDSKLWLDFLALFVECDCWNIELSCLVEMIQQPGREAGYGLD
jgi:hypothetical protein